MTHQSYPKWLFGASGSVLVLDAKAHEALSGDWYESPADVPSTTKEAAIDREALIEQAQAKGFKVDKRWSDARLSEEIDKA